MKIPILIIFNNACFNQFIQNLPFKYKLLHELI